MAEGLEQAAEASLPSGVEGLDLILGGGFAPKRLYLIEGDPGAGKTTLSLQFLRAGAERGERGLYITLSETSRELEAVMRSHGWPLGTFEIKDVVVTEDDLSPDSQVTMYHPSEVELGETIRRIIQSVEEHKPARVVIDSLTELRLLSQNSLRYRRQIMALKQFFLGRDCTVLLLDDRTAEGPDHQLQSIAHGVLSLAQLAPEYGAERRRLRVTKFRGRSYRGGYHDYAILTGGITMYPRLVASHHHRDYQTGLVPSGVSRLDQLLGGGPERGTSTLFLGPAGAGKTTVAVQYVVAAAERGERGAIFTFDENLRTMLARAAAVGMPLERHVEAGRIHLQQIDPAELSAGEFAHVVREQVEEQGARLVLIDSINGYQNAMPEERFLTLHLHELFMFLSQHGVTTLLTVAQHGIVGSMQSPIDASYLADSIVLFRFFEDAGRVRRAISVVKKRGGPHENQIRELIVDKGGLVLGEPLSDFRGVLTGVPFKINGELKGDLGGV